MFPIFASSPKMQATNPAAPITARLSIKKDRTSCSYVHQKITAPGSRLTMIWNP